MQKSDERIFSIYRDLLPLFPDDLHLARPLIGLLQQAGQKEAAAKLAMMMARRMQVGGRYGEVQGFLAMARQLGYPDQEELRDMESMAQIMGMSEGSGEVSQGVSFSLVEQLSDQEVREFLLQGEQVDVRAGNVVVMQGEVSSSFFLIMRGTMDVLLNTSGGEKVKLATLHAGDYFGEFACIYQIPRSATVRAASDAKLLKLSDAVIRDLMARSPIAGERLMRVVQQRMITSLTYEHPAFAELPAGDRQWLAESSTIREFKAGEDICQDAALPNLWLILIHGRAEWIVRFKPGGDVPAGAMITGASKYLKREQTMVRARDHVLVCEAPVAIFSSFMKAYGGFDRWVKGQGLPSSDV